MGFYIIGIEVPDLVDKSMGIIEVPEPHGALIDRDAFANSLMREAKQYWNLLKPETQQIIQSICNDIRNYPAVIEAEGVETTDTEPSPDKFPETLKSLIPVSDEEQTREEKLISHCNEYWLKHEGCKECPFKGNECREFLDKYHDTPFLYVRDRKESVTDEQN